MRTSTKRGSRVVVARVLVDDDSLTAELSDGRKIKVPLDWYPRLAEGTAAERAKYHLVGGGSGIHWPALDDDVSLDNLLHSRKSAESQSSFDQWLKGRPSQKSDPSTTDRPVGT